MGLFAKHIAANTISALDYAPLAFKTNHFVADSLGISAFSFEVQQLMGAVAVVPATSLEIKDGILPNGNFSSGASGLDGWSVVSGSASVAAGVATVTTTPGVFASYLQTRLVMPHKDFPSDDPLHTSTALTNQVLLVVKFKVSNMIPSDPPVPPAVRCRLGQPNFGSLTRSSESQTIWPGIRDEDPPNAFAGQTYEELMVMAMRPNDEPDLGWIYDFRIQALKCASYDIESVSVHRVGFGGS